jgi:hypothetical protein
MKEITIVIRIHEVIKNTRCHHFQIGGIITRLELRKGCNFIIDEHGGLSI